MSIWRRGPVTTNPYVRTAFRVARVPREVTRHRTVVQLIGQTRQVVGADPQAHAIRGEAVTIVELNQAEKTLLDAPSRVLEELLHHAAERTPLARARRLLREAAEQMAPAEEGRLPVTNLRALEPWTGHVVREFLDSLPDSDPSFGALELGLVAPFGPPRGR